MPEPITVAVAGAKTYGGINAILLLAGLAGGAGVLSIFTPIHMLPTMAIAGSAAWLVADRRGTR